MKLDEATVNSMTIVRWHRIGTVNNELDGNKFNRPIIVRFFNYNDRMLVWAKRFELANENKSISENFANNMFFYFSSVFGLYNSMERQRPSGHACPGFC